jgi:hypothetical protein
MAGCLDVDSTMIVMETNSAGRSKGESRKVRLRLVLLLQMDISGLNTFSVVIANGHKQT